MKCEGCITETATLKSKKKKFEKKHTGDELQFHIHTAISINCQYGNIDYSSFELLKSENSNQFHTLQHLYHTYTSTLTLLYKLDSNFPTKPFTQIMWRQPLSTRPDFDIQITIFLKMFYPPIL